MTMAIAILIVGSALIAFLLFHDFYIGSAKRAFDRDWIKARKDKDEKGRETLREVMGWVSTAMVAHNEIHQDINRAMHKQATALGRLADAQQRMARHVAPDEPRLSSEEWMEQERNKARREEARRFKDRGPAVPRRPFSSDSPIEATNQAFKEAARALDSQDTYDLSKHKKEGLK